MLPPSDNFFAETLVKDLGARFGGAGTTAAGAAVVRRTIASLLGIPPARRRRLGPLRSRPHLALRGRRPARRARPDPDRRVLREHMAVAGQHRHARLRMRDTGAAGRCQGKTGTLTGVSNLVGYCQAADGHVLAFAIFTDGIPTESAHVFQDHMAITLADSRRASDLASSSARSAASSSTGTRQALGLLELRPRALAGDEVVGLLRHRPGHAPARGHDPLGGLLARPVRAACPSARASCPPAAPPRGAAPASSKRSPIARRSAISARIRSSSSCARIACAIFSPTPGVSAISSRRGGQQRVDVAKALREVAPGDLADLLDPEREQHARERAAAWRPRSPRAGCARRPRRSPRARSAAPPSSR